MTKISSSTQTTRTAPARPPVAPPPATREPTQSERVALSAESQRPEPEPSGSVSALSQALGALNEVSAADHAEWGGQTTTPNGEVIEPGLTEAEDGRYQRVGEYWEDVGMNDWDGRTDQPWSSAYISSLHERAGITNFEGSIRHSTYIGEAIDARQEEDDQAPYWGYRPEERAPQAGDLLCWTRAGSAATYDDQQGGRYPSHCDRVQSVGDDTITTLGGNVGDSVSTREFAIDENGMLDDDSQNWIATLAPHNLRMD